MGEEGCDFEITEQKVSCPSPKDETNTCDYVPKIPNINSIRVHKEAQHLGVRHDCPHCAKTWTTRSNMQKHVVKTHSSNVPVDIKSDVIKEVGERRTGLKTKRKKQEVLKTKKREMSQLEELELELEEEKSVHIEVESVVDKEVKQRRTRRKREELDKEPLEKCDLCDYVPKIPNRNSIRVHEEAKHLGVRHDCRHCGKSWTTRSNMLRCSHVLKTKKKRRNREEIRKELFDSCDLCDYVPKIPNRYSIKVHKEAQHFGLKHDCQHCGKTWSTRSNMLKHVMAAHPEQVLQCGQCSYKTTSKGYLKGHSYKYH